MIRLVGIDRGQLLEDREVLVQFGLAAIDLPQLDHLWATMAIADVAFEVHAVAQSIAPHHLRGDEYVIRSLRETPVPLAQKSESLVGNLEQSGARLDRTAGSGIRARRTLEIADAGRAGRRRYPHRNPEGVRRVGADRRDAARGDHRAGGGAGPRGLHVPPAAGTSARRMTSTAGIEGIGGGAASRHARRRQGRRHFGWSRRRGYFRRRRCLPCPRGR